MNAITQTEARAIQTPVLEAADPTKNLILVPLSRLVLRPTGRNVRKTPRMSIPELAASIQRVGLLQNLIVIASANGEHYEVVAGGRRLAAGDERGHHPRLDVLEPRRAIDGQVLILHDADEPPTFRRC